mmetsp:Transcript_4202/g.10389  ORF Transcript_4202/g.10389 Transcript_4202/m.10389 type:complete len:118 (+) Transcript_4202:1516-1869(+)
MLVAAPVLAYVPVPKPPFTTISPDTPAAAQSSSPQSVLLWARRDATAAKRATLAVLIAQIEAEKRAIAALREEEGGLVARRKVRDELRARVEEAVRRLEKEVAREGEAVKRSAVGGM